VGVENFSETFRELWRCIGTICHILGLQVREGCAQLPGLRYKYPLPDRAPPRMKSAALSPRWYQNLFEISAAGETTGLSSQSPPNLPSTFPPEGRDAPETSGQSGHARMAQKKGFRVPGSP